jgi:predicted GIY-YIG superfamily endonuclease
MQVAMEYEKEKGRQVHDVHEKNFGYDLTSLDLNSGELRLIEVKGIGGSAGNVLLTPNEKRVAEDRRDCYWLYVVTDCNLPAPRPDTFWVYAIKCDDGSIYIGQTDNLPRRWKEHRAGQIEWTSRHKPLYVVHYESFATREEAVKREQDLKTGFGRKWLKKHIESGRARQAGSEPQLQNPIKDPARLQWHEVKKVGHYYLSIDAVTQPMQVREETVPYGDQEK